MPRTYERKTAEEKLEGKYEIVTESGCWIWTGLTSQQGYGVIRVQVDINKVRSLFAHRVSYKKHKGDFDPSKFVCHKCDVPSCVNPNHLFLGDVVDNNQDKINKGREARNELHGKSILTNEQVSEVRSKFKKGVPQQKMADEYGVSFSCINQIVHNRTRTKT